MKKASLFLFFALCFSFTFGQGKELQQVIVVMAEQCDAVGMARSTQFMNKTQRRQFVTDECQAFCQASQQEVLGLLNSLNGDVQDIRPFWLFNGIACKATEEAIQQLETRRDVAYVYRDALRKMVPEFTESKATSSRGNAWHVDQINAPAVWNYNGSTGYDGNGVVVAVVDSGVDYNHIDIAGSMWDGGTNYPHHGYDIVNDDDDPMDEYCHGTHVAGIVAGQGNAGTQTGIAPGAKIMAIKVLDASGYGYDSDVISGIHFAMNHGADIINISAGEPGVGGCDFYRVVMEEINEAGLIAAVAAGNVGDQQYAYSVPNNINSPGNCPPPWLHPDQVSLISGGTSAVISVGATDNIDKHCSFSSVGPATWAYGEYIGDYNDYPYVNGDASQPGLIRPDISAPGKNVTSLNYLTGNGYIEYDGTSMATPCVSGVLALMLQANPELTPAELDSIIELTAVKIGNYKKNNHTGSGRIDALAAINALFYHGPTNLTADFDGETVNLNWEAPSSVASYEVYRDGLRIGNNITATNYTDHLEYGGIYTYYVNAVLDNGLTTLPSNYVYVEKNVDIEAEVINNQRVDLTWNMPNSIVDGFESGDFYQNMWINDGTSPWVITTNNPSEGIYSAKSTNTAMFSNSSIKLAVNIPVTSVISYDAYINCTPLNGGGFLIDNIQQGETIKDSVPWTRYSFPLTPGNHLLEWKYANQLALEGYENAFYIDNITVGNPFNVYRDNCTGSLPELIAEKVAEAHYVDYGWDALPIGQYKYGISNDEGLHIAWSECLDKTVMAVVENEEPTEIRRITIINTLGQVVYDANANSDNSAQVLKQFPEGIYVVRILTEKGIEAKKIKR